MSDNCNHTSDDYKIPEPHESPECFQIDESPEVFGEVKNAWQSNAEQLAAFCSAKLVNRKDAFGYYLPVNERKSQDNARTAKNPATFEIIREHFESGDHSGLIGLHTTSEENTCRWLAIDVDAHGQHDETVTVRNVQFGLEIYSFLCEQGITPLLCSSNGLGGLHIWLVFDEPVAAAEVRKFGVWLASSWDRFQLPGEPEVFPKQDSVEPGKFGNWVRLPGLHHTRDFFTRVWDGACWRSGQEAIDLILNFQPIHFEKIRDKLPDAWIEEEPAVDLPELQEAETHWPIDMVVKKLRGVKPSGTGFMACCPSHRDRNPSLSVNEAEDGKVLLHCFAGCETEKIVAAIGLDMLDLFPRQPRLRSNIDTHLRARISMARESISQPFREQIAKFKKLQPYRIGELAAQLKVSDESLRMLEVVWSAEDQAWVFPERNGKREIVGLLQRNTDGTKQVMPGSKRGLFIPKSFDPLQNYIFIAEGASDTAAGLDCGLNIVGRPSSDMGSEFLVELLASASGIIHVLRDNDVRRDGTWPGKVGAEKVASKLASALKTEVMISTLPLDFKDLREMLKGCRTNELI